MQRGIRDRTRPLTIVIGCGEVGSAIAVALHRAGFAVVLIDEADPGRMRRGMSFTNAWFAGNAELEGEEAIFCSSLRSVPTVLDRNDAIAATTWSWPGIAAALLPLALIDARATWQRPAAVPLSRLPEGLFAIGVGRGFVAGRDVHAVVETAPGDRVGRVIRQGGAESRRMDPPLLGGAGRERFVYTLSKGRFHTSCRIGERVQREQPIAAVGGEAIRAPLAGVLRGISHRGAHVEAGVAVVEVDPRDDPAMCYGIEERPRRIADGVLEALALAVDVPRARVSDGRRLRQR